MSKHPPLQFGLRTMLLGMTAFAILCGLVAWCGLTGRTGVSMIIVILGAGAGTFIGLLICSYAGLGFGFEDLKWEVVKCLALGAVTVLSAYGLLSLAPVYHLLAITIILMIVCIKLFWPDVEGVEILIVGFSAVSAAGIARSLASYWIGG
jgi:hypothetical protein